MLLRWRSIAGLIAVNGPPASGGPEALVTLQTPGGSSVCGWCPLRLCSAQPAQLYMAALGLRIPIQGFSPLHKESLRGCLLPYGGMACLQGLCEFFERGHNCVYRLVFIQLSLRWARALLTAPPAHPSLVCWSHAGGFALPPEHSGPFAHVGVCLCSFLCPDGQARSPCAPWTGRGRGIRGPGRPCAPRGQGHGPGRCVRSSAGPCGPRALAREPGA